MNNVLHATHHPLVADAHFILVFFRTMMISEDNALDYFGKTRSDIFQLDDISEQLFRLEKGKIPVEMYGCDCVHVVAQFMALPVNARIAVSTAIGIMDVLDRRGMIGITKISWQKWCVIHTFAPWCLVPDGRFHIGLCYHGNYGDAPTQMRHLHNFVHL